MILRASSSGIFIVRSSETGTGAMSVVRQSGVRPALLYRARVRVVSPPVKMTRSTSPARIWREAVFTKVCGVLPPMADRPSSRGVSPRSLAMKWAGLPYFHDKRLTTRMASGFGTEDSPASEAASEMASTMSATGSRASSRPSARCSTWPVPIRTGVRGSIVMP